MSLLAATIPVQAVSLLVGDNGVATHLGLFASELFGTFILILLGAGVVAGVSLPKSYAKDAGWVVITFAWVINIAVIVEYSDRIAIIK